MVRSSSSKIRAVLMSFRFWRRCAADPFTVSAAGFNQPAAICACDVRLLRPALFLSATPMDAHVLHPFLLIEELCNVVHTRAERVTLRSHPSGQPHTFFFSLRCSSAGAAGPVHQGQLSAEGPRANSTVPPKTWCGPVATPPPFASALSLSSPPDRLNLLG